MYLVLLFLLLGGLAWRNRIDLKEYAAFRMVEDSAARRGFYWRWTGISFVLFGVGAVALLAVLGRLDALTVFPAEFAGLRPDLSVASAPADSDTQLGMSIGIAIGLLIAVGIWAWRIRKVAKPVIGDVEPLMPRNARELLAAIPLAINAGVSEELFFRLVLPLVATHATGSALAGFLIAGAAFGLVHWYQGWKGVIAVTCVGALMTWLYLRSGSLLSPILVHAAMDLVALIVRPAIGMWAERRRGLNWSENHG